MFYRSVVESVLCFCIVFWFGNSTLTDQKKLERIIKSAKRLGCDVKKLDVMYLDLTIKKANQIVKDIDHPLNSLFKFLPSGSRLSSVFCRTNRYKMSFIPAAIRALNKSNL